MAEIARQVVLRLRQAGARPADGRPAAPPAARRSAHGVFATVDEAVEAAAAAQRRIRR